MIAIKNLTVGFGNKTILKNLNGEIKPGELIALMGINGAGKSCLLKTLTNLNPIQSGDITLEGKSYSEIPPLEIAKKLAVVLTEKFNIDFLRVDELVTLGRSPFTSFWGGLSRSDENLVNAIIDLLNLGSIKERFFADLSDGQKQKVLLARALAQEPNYLFLDEPTTYLDIPSKIELMKILKKISLEKNMAVFFSTHDLSLVEKHVDRIWLIDGAGELHKKSPEEMLRSGLLEKNFNL
jgi:iron complex transport system ATP-binding protein